MKWIQRICLRGLPLGIVLAIFSSGYGQSTLISIKKGNRGNKSWAVFTFDKKALWVGLSQPEVGKISLYFLGYPGTMEGSVVTIDTAFNRSILVSRVRETPPIFKADIMYEPDIPVSILKKDGNIVLALNDERLLDGSTILYGEETRLPSRLVEVSPTVEPTRVSTSIGFEKGFEWVGYVRTSSHFCSILLRNAELALSQTAYPIQRGGIQHLELVPMEGEIPGVKVNVQLLPNAQFNVAMKPNTLVLESSFKEGTPFPEEEAPVVAEATPEARVSLPEIKEKPQIKTPPVSAQPAVSVPSSEEIPWDQRVSFEFRDTPVKDALRLVAVSNKLNMVISEGVKGKVTMKLQNVTLRQALDKILHTNECDYWVDGNIITVRPLSVATTAGRVTQVYRLKYADAVNVAKVVRRIATNDSLVEVFYPEFLDFDVSGKNRVTYELSTVQGIRRSSILVVTDIPEKIREISHVIDELDRPPPQIVIESKLVEVSPYYTNKLGIDWENTFNLEFYTSPPSDAKEFRLQNVPVGTAISPFSFTRSITTGRLSSAEYTALLDFLKEKTDSKLISNPRILATDNEEASISVGKTVPVARISRGMGGTGDMVMFDYKEISIRLNVTPHVLGNNEIAMYVNPILEEISDWKIMFGNEAPVTDKRSVNSIVTVKSGETIVIGGLIKNQRIQTTKRLWLLGSLPLIGKLFQHEVVEDRQTDLMIFITPTIVEQSS